MKTQNSVDGRRAESAKLNVEISLSELTMLVKAIRESAYDCRVFASSPNCSESAWREATEAVKRLERRAKHLSKICPEQWAERQPPAENGGQSGGQVAGKTVGSEDWRPNLSAYSVCKECGVIHSAQVRCLVTAKCHECGGRHEPSGARSDCIAYWRQRAWKAEGVTAHANDKVSHGGADVNK